MTFPTSTDPAIAPDAFARRNVTLLMGAQALGGASPPIIISLGGIVGQSLASDATLSTLPVSLYNLGLALSTIPAALLMRRLSRRSAYLLGASLGGLAGLVAAFAIMRSDFVLFCIGTAMAGFYGACVHSYRFAATDSAPLAWRPIAISRVMLGGLAAAVIGPQVVIWTRDAIASAPFAGSFFGQTALALIALPLLLPIVIGCSESLAAVFAAGSADPLPGRWLMTIGLYDLVFALLAFALFDYLVED